MALNSLAFNAAVLGIQTSITNLGLQINQLAAAVSGDESAVESADQAVLDAGTTQLGQIQAGIAALQDQAAKALAPPPPQANPLQGQ